MKKVIALTAIVIMLIAPGMANASFFDDSGGKWWMAEDQWTYSSGGGMAISKSGTLLKVTSTNEGTDSHAFYVSNWLIDLNQNASFSVTFNYDAADTTHTGGLTLGLMSGNLGDNGNVGMYGGYVSSKSKPAYMWSWNLPAPTGEGTSTCLLERISGLDYDWGTLDAQFTTGLGTPRLSFLSDDGALKTFYMSFLEEGADNYARVFIGAGSFGGVSILAGEAYLGEFQLKAGTTPVAPEPVSSALFLLGGAALAARQYRKRGKKAA